MSAPLHRTTDPAAAFRDVLSRASRAIEAGGVNDAIDGFALLWIKRDGQFDSAYSVLNGEETTLANALMSMGHELATRPSPG